MAKYHIGWWNLENLFDIQDDPKRPEWLQRYLNRELKGWTAEVLDTKLNQLSSIIIQMNDGLGPDILGVCEVENRAVLEKLIGKLAGLGRTYNIALHDGKDKRGIDVAFIYDSAKFTSHEQFSYRVTKRTPTRDIFQVNFRTAQNRDLILLGNHWPARMPSMYESEPYRLIAAETLSYWMGRIAEKKGKDAPVLVLGDFNDDPFDRSFSDYALGTNNRQKVMNARTSPWLLNFMAKSFCTGKGSVFYSGPYMFDQILGNKGIIKSTSVIKAIPEMAKVDDFPSMCRGSYNEPRRFGRPSSKSSFDPGGFSDHFPVSVKVVEKD